MIRTQDDLRATLEHHARSQPPEAERLVAVIRSLSAEMNRPVAPPRRTRPLMVAAAVIAIAVTAIVVIGRHSAPIVDRSASAPVVAAPFAFTAVDGQTEYSYPSDQRGQMPELAGNDRSGTPVGLPQFDGQVTVINVWGSWCAPCRDEAAALGSAYRALHPQDVAFLGIDVRDTVAGSGTPSRPYPSIFDPDMKSLLPIRGFPIGSLPMTIVLDRQHRVAHLWLQEVTEPELTATVTALLAEG